MVETITNDPGGWQGGKENSTKIFWRHKLTHFQGYLLRKCSLFVLFCLRCFKTFIFVLFPTSFLVIIYVSFGFVWIFGGWGRGIPPIPWLAVNERKMCVAIIFDIFFFARSIPLSLVSIICASTFHIMSFVLFCSSSRSAWFYLSYLVKFCGPLLFFFGIIS